MQNLLQISQRQGIIVDLPRISNKEIAHVIVSVGFLLKIMRIRTEECNLVKKQKNNWLFIASRGKITGRSY